MHMIESVLCADDKLFCTHDWIWTDDWILCSAHQYPHTCTHDWSIEAKRIILGHFRHTPDTIDGQPRIARSQISMFWSELNSTKIVGAPPWRSKTLVHRGGKAPIFNFWLVRNSGDGSWIFIWYPVYTLWKYPEWIFWAWFSFLGARAHLVPNQGSSRLALVSRLKLDRVSLMGIRVEFETKCQCLYWSLIKSLRKQILKICSAVLYWIPFWETKGGSGSGPTVSFPLIWLWQTGQPLAGC